MDKNKSLTGLDGVQANFYLVLAHAIEHFIENDHSVKSAIKAGASLSEIENAMSDGLTRFKGLFLSGAVDKYLEVQYYTVSMETA